LDEFEYSYTQEGIKATESKPAKPEIVYKFLVEFSLHCFTIKPNKNKGETLSDFCTSLYYKDSRETRVFCFERYKLSKNLPQIAKEISERQCYHTGKGNFFVIELTDKEGQSAEYEIYFKVSRAGSKLKLFIESAYIRDKEHSSSQPSKKKIKFFVIAHNVRNGKPIKTPK